MRVKTTNFKISPWTIEAKQIWNNLNYENVPSNCTFSCLFVPPQTKSKLPPPHPKVKQLPPLTPSKTSNPPPSKLKQLGLHFLFGQKSSHSCLSLGSVIFSQMSVAMRGNHFNKKVTTNSLSIKHLSTEALLSCRLEKFILKCRRTCSSSSVGRIWNHIASGSPITICCPMNYVIYWWAPSVFTMSVL